MARLSPFLRQLELPLKFQTKNSSLSYYLDEAKFISFLGKDQIRLERNQDNSMHIEGLKNSDDYESIESLFRVNIIEDNKVIDLNILPVINAVFEEIEILDQKPAIYYYFTISANLMYISTLKRRVGLEKIYEFLKKILLSLSICKNKDIDNYFNEEFLVLEESNDINTSNEFKNDFEKHLSVYSKKSQRIEFLLEKTLKSCLIIIKI